MALKREGWTARFIRLFIMRMREMKHTKFLKQDNNEKQKRCKVLFHESGHAATTKGEQRGAREQELTHGLVLSLPFSGGSPLGPFAAPSDPHRYESQAAGIPTHTTDLRIKPGEDERTEKAGSKWGRISVAGIFP